MELDPEDYEALGFGDLISAQNLFITERISQQTAARRVVFDKRTLPQSVETKRKRNEARRMARFLMIQKNRQLGVP